MGVFLMGACLEPTADMGGWYVEVRGESAYLNGPTLVNKDKGAFAIPLINVAHVISALDQIMSHGAYTGWLIEWGSSTGPQWETEVAGDYLELTGPAYLYGGAEGAPWLRGSVELPYEQLELIRAALVSVANGGESDV